jgi:Polyketide cyclase / dehydrase and lipid transport
MEWHRISGDFKEVDGFWKLEPTELGRCTMVTYASHVNGGFFMPQLLIKRQLRNDMPTALTALKNKAEGPTQIASRHQIDRTQ